MSTSVDPPVQIRKSSRRKKRIEDKNEELRAIVVARCGCSECGAVLGERCRLKRARSDGTTSRITLHLARIKRAADVRV